MISVALGKTAAGLDGERSHCVRDLAFQSLCC